MKNYTPTKEEFDNKIKSYITNTDSLALIDKAYNFAQEKRKLSVSPSQQYVPE